MAFWRLPEEILGLVINRVQDREDLLTISLVSHLFYRFTFPLIHHTTVLQTVKRIVEFIELVKLKTDNGRTQISQVIHCLIFHQDLGNVLGGVPLLEEQLVLELQSIVPHLAGLHHLTWAIADSPINPTIFEDFRRWCPKLRSIHLRGRGVLLDDGWCLFP